MKSIPGILITLLIWCSCQRAATPDTRDLDLAVASQFIDAFYSFNKDSLDVILVHAPDSKPEILYYQQWAKCGHYEIKGKFVRSELPPTTRPNTTRQRSG